ncbi:hypothetical protein ACHAWF_001650 [Thalassiosira exigua]
MGRATSAVRVRKLVARASHDARTVTLSLVTFVLIGLTYFRLWPTGVVPVVNNRIKYHRTSSSKIMSKGYQDYIKDDYRGFIFATHPVYGMLLLHCTRKKKKGPHFQAPGGHVDEVDFKDARGRNLGSSKDGPALLMLACKIGAAREIFEETGIDIRSNLDRLHPVRLHENSNESIFCEHKKRLFFKICLDDRDFFTDGIESKVALGLNQPMNNKPPPLMLKLSDEHQGFMFEPDATKSVDLLVQHSGGKVSSALRLAIEHDEVPSVVKDAVVVEKPGTVDGSKIVGNPMMKEEGETRNSGCFGCC